MIPYRTILAVAGIAVAVKTASVIGGGDNPVNIAALAQSAGVELSREIDQDPEVRDELPEILVAIAAEHEALDRKRAEIEARQARIDLAADALDNQIAQLETLQATINGLVSDTDGNQNDDLERLVRIYRAMKPAQAGAIMTDMDIEVAVLVLAAMDESTAGPIMANMSPVRARAVSKIIFERSRLPGNQNLINVRLN